MRIWNAEHPSRSVPAERAALVRAPQASTSRGRSTVLINIVTRCVSNGATKSADSSVNSVDLQRSLSHKKTSLSHISLR